MQTIQSRLYTNVALTAIVILLAILAFRPLFSVSTPAHAEDEETNPGGRTRVSIPNSNTHEKDLQQYGMGTGDTRLAKATEEMAKAQAEIAIAIRETGQAQADALESLAKAVSPQ
ncbi:hypothetical protein HYR69_06055 [Candidatus Sumerlaeota bacterium]|nr:hypothetical protein [Candidatus Sumerlaeota bacterium]MBI3736841.1 hypothetical protein [Candidatus Sumerlaeota bacterium]